MTTKENGNIARIDELFTQIERADGEIRAIIAAESESAPDFSSAFFAQLQQRVKSARISDLMVLMLAIHAGSRGGATEAPYRHRGPSRSR